MVTNSLNLGAVSPSRDPLGDAARASAVAASPSRWWRRGRGKRGSAGVGEGWGGGGRGGRTINSETGSDNQNLGRYSLCGFASCVLLALLGFTTKHINLRCKADSEEKNINSSSLKSCSDCHTTRTPLWRGGPAGPKSLCNACGIKYNKKRRQLLGLDTGRSNRKKKRTSVSRSDQVGETLKMRFMALGSDMVLQRSGKLMSKLREEEQAAVLLMALSCGSVYA
ncbi:GATA transcription factor 15 [Sesamum angolense]|uniref:GATA transcription factor 15 n=1 Tax=Sesamum angolense TaxID=2727404 RepID=A0AAE1X8Z9_9LAMI|nr:GATA transcription factor 15 [Sesamum angolense]